MGPCTHIKRVGACRSASPGKLGKFEEELFRSAEMSETPVVMAVTVAMVEGAPHGVLSLCCEPDR